MSKISDVNWVLAMFHGLWVAEGVENALIWDKLKALSCDEAQGYFMSKPVPLDDFVAWRLKWNASHSPVAELA